MCNNQLNGLRITVRFLTFKYLKKLHNSTNDVIVEKLKKTIDNKLDVLEIPSDKEINTIENYLLEGNGLKLKNNIYKRLYKY